MAWVVYATLVSSPSTPANIGTLSLKEPTPGGEDFELTIANGAGAGAANVGTINLTDAGFTGYSSIEGGSIGGNLTGGLTLVQDSGGNGGEITFTIDGDVSGAISVPVVKSLWIVGTLSADIDVTSAIDNGTLLLDGAVASGVHITVADMVNGVIWNNPASEFNADITFGNGVPSGSGVAIHSENTSHVTYDFNNADLGGIFACKWDTDADFVNGGALTGTLKVGRASCFDYVGSMTFASVSATGKIDLSPCIDLDGTISITADMEGDITVDGNILTTRSISIGGDVIGAISIEDDVAGDINLNGDLTSLGSVTVGGALANAPHAGGGRILVTGESTGAIKVGKKTGSLTLIHLAGGLATGATIEINTTEGNFNAEGAIYVGAGAACFLNPPDVTFDGCIRIYNDSASGHYGNLEGAIGISGCHNAGDLNICVDGSDNGNVNICQNGCTNQVGWSCDTCP
ncbi:MAG: hypothetical protein IID34_05365 [Planctomycetes bacterium]|nr:hypothetical protein [Planctomycetota bacterium]